MKVRSLQYLKREILVWLSITCSWNYFKLSHSIFISRKKQPKCLWKELIIYCISYCWLSVIYLIIGGKKQTRTKKNRDVISCVPPPQKKNSNRSILFNLFVLLDLIHFWTKSVSKCRNCVFLLQFFWSCIFLLSSGHKRGLKKRG